MRPDRLFKYVTAKTAESILENGTLRWSSPDAFNDPFDLKHNVEFGFEWEEIRAPLIARFQEVLMGDSEPALHEGSDFIDPIRLMRQAVKGRPPEVVRAQIAEILDTFIPTWQSTSRQEREDYIRRKKNFRILCLSEIHDNILMWSHYAQNHTGVVLAFKPYVRDSAFLAAEKVNYVDEVPLVLTREEFLDVMTARKPRPDTSDLFKRCVYRKSTDWAYEKEWRIFSTKKDSTELFSDRRFQRNELVGIYFGCRLEPVVQRTLQEIATKRAYPAKKYKMQEEKYRYKLEALPLSSTE
jgi:hypothetical protein